MESASGGKNRYFFFLLSVTVVLKGRVKMNKHNILQNI